MKLKNIMLFIFLTMTISSSCSQTIPLLVNITGGKFVMGYDSIPIPKRVEDDAIPLVNYYEHIVDLDSFKISKYEITFTEFFEFLKDTAYITEAEKEWVALYPEKIGKESIRQHYNDSLYPAHPATWINYEDALMYCYWLSRKTGRTFRLPTEAEWEYAATGGEMVLFPWGNFYRQLDFTHTIDDDVDASFQKDVFSVNHFFEDVSTFGVYGTHMEM
jgi:formylglycine-generating enzyme required for sulfatase activity